MIMKCEKVSCVASAGAPTVSQHAGQTSLSPFFNWTLKHSMPFIPCWAVGPWHIVSVMRRCLIAWSLFLASHFNFKLPQCG